MKLYIPIRLQLKMSATSYAELIYSFILMDHDAAQISLTKKLEFLKMWHFLLFIVAVMIETYVSANHIVDVITKGYISP